jgi:hypothetical protein
MSLKFDWHLNVNIDRADVDIEVNYECVTVEVNDFEAETTITMNADLIDECLSIDEVTILRDLCIDALNKRAKE